MIIESYRVFNSILKTLAQYIIYGPFSWNILVEGFF